MDPNEIEVLLRKAPRPQPPEGLAERLQAGMRYPRADVPPKSSFADFGWFKRWFPATAMLVCLIAGAGLLAMQSRSLSKLRQEHQQLRTRLAAPEAGARQNLSAAELEDLRNDFAEVQRLKIEIAKLRARTGELVQLRAENDQLRRELAGLHGGPSPEITERMAAQKCVNNLKQIGLAARIYAQAHQDVYPKNFLEITNELYLPKILHCPSDLDRPEIINWADFTLESASYQSRLAPDLIGDPEAIIARCPIHDSVCLADGSVYQSLARFRIQTVIRDGREYLVLPQAPTNAPASFE